MKYGLQLYSVRDIADKDMDTALREVAAMGYSSVEFAGFMGHSAEEIKAMLDKYGITAIGSHTSIDLLNDENYDATTAFNKAIGNKNIAIPSAKLGTKKGIDTFVETVNSLIPRLEEQGMKLHYHNHDFEFEKNEDGIIPEYEIINRTAINLEVDTYWVFNAGVDAIEFINEHKDRISLIHLKDGIKGGTGRSLGLGDAKAAQVRKAAIELGFDMIVESETLDPTGLQEVERCINFLKEEDAKDNK